MRRSIMDRRWSFFKRMKDYHLIHPVKEFGIECLLEFIHDIVLIC